MCISPFRKSIARTYHPVTRKVSEEKAPKKKQRKGVKLKEYQWVSCGECYMCINKKRRDWAFRLYWERKRHRDAWFVMVTYNEENVPLLDTSTGELNLGITDKQGWLNMDKTYRVLYKKDLQDFLNKLRNYQAYYEKKYSAYKMDIRYFACGEYGDDTGRPHYHILLFGVRPEIMEQAEEKVWKKGFISYKRYDDSKAYSGCMYLTKYVYKQQLEKSLPVNPFILMSKKPPIGRNFIEKNAVFILKNGTWKVPIGNKIVRVPTFYRKYINIIKRNAINVADVNEIRYIQSEIDRVIKREGQDPLKVKRDYIKNQIKNG